MPNTIQLTLCANGPVLLTGNGVVTVAGQSVAAPAAGRVSLCRCGASANKPFCDGSHGAAGFQAPAGTLSIELPTA